MGGTNPYIEKTEYDLPRSSYTITYIEPDGTVTKVAVDPAKIPYGPTGLPGSILDVAMANGVDLEHVCGGVCACSTCHVIVDQEDFERLKEPTEDEEDMLDLAFGLTVTSRLGCQIIITEELDGLVVKLPSSTRNLLLG